MKTFELAARMVAVVAIIFIAAYVVGDLACATLPAHWLAEACPK